MGPPRLRSAPAGVLVWAPARRSSRVRVSSTSAMATAPPIAVSARRAVSTVPTEEGCPSCSMSRASGVMNRVAKA
ncbi:hypothetical protein AN277_0206510 [Rothia kristinae]|uniref:Uncharacterized protein n=1 Tax=Rothia kristinae TaxID=37923 RepID=A0A199NT04_9MICC|nr:hypothetical protein AN277_0206510 [Rothia kristinae]